MAVFTALDADLNLPAWSIRTALRDITNLKLPADNSGYIEAISRSFP